MAHVAFPKIPIHYKRGKLIACTEMILSGLWSTIYCVTTVTIYFTSSALQNTVAFSTLQNSMRTLIELNRRLCNLIITLSHIAILLLF